MTPSISWRKRGMIFKAETQTLPKHCIGFAQSPQAIELKDRIRVYFSTRSQHGANGKFVSQVSFVDFEPGFGQMVGVASDEVLSPGQLGAFDEHGVFPFHALSVDDHVWAYTCGWSRRRAVSVETGIGLAVSSDGGSHFERRGIGPVLSATLNEPCLVGDGFVRRYDGQFHMWYIYGKPWHQFEGHDEPDRIYKIAHAKSMDGVHWEKTGAPQLVEDVLGPQECQALPTVAHWQGRYHMYFCFRYADDFRNNRERAYRLGYAWSNDLVTWNRDDAAAGIERSNDPKAWDRQMMCYPNLFQHNGQLFLLYNGNDFGRHGFGLAVADTGS